MSRQSTAKCRIFISYSSKNPDVAVSLRDKLEVVGIDSWLAVSSIRAGDEWRKEIDDGILTSDLLVVILDKDSVKSHYVTYEWSFALGNDVPILVVKTEECDVHKRLEPLQNFPFFIESDGQRPWEKLIKFIQSIQHRKKPQTRIELLERNVFPVESRILTAENDVFISGSALASLYKYVDVFKDISRRKRNIKLLSMDCDIDEVAEQFCKMTGKGNTPDALRLQYDAFRNFYQADSGIRDNNLIEVRKVDAVTPIVYIGVDVFKSSKQTFIKVQHYLHEKSGYDAPNYVVSENHSLFKLYREQIHTLWNKGKPYN